jgi:hypothetical protein
MKQEKILDHALLAALLAVVALVVLLALMAGAGEAQETKTPATEGLVPTAVQTAVCPSGFVDVVAWFTPEGDVKIVSYAWHNQHIIWLEYGPDDEVSRVTLDFDGNGTADESGTMEEIKTRYPSPCDPIDKAAAQPAKTNL